MSKFIIVCLYITIGLGLITAGTILCPIFLGLSLMQIFFLYQINEEVGVSEH